MQDSITTHIMQVGRPMKRVTVEYIIYHYNLSTEVCGAHWRDYLYFPDKQSAIDDINESKSFKTRRPDGHYKLIKRETIEEEIELP